MQKKKERNNNNNEYTVLQSSQILNMTGQCYFYENKQYKKVHTWGIAYFYGESQCFSYISVL